MEDQVILKLVESGGAFGLLAFLAWGMLGMLRTLIESLTKMGAQLAQSNADLSAALRETEQARIEAQQSHQEQLLLMRVMAQRLEERNG